MLRNQKAGRAFLADYDFTPLQSRYERDFPAFAGSFPAVSDELRRFYELALVQDGPLAALSDRVDRLWHCHILDTAQYWEFCEGLTSDFIDHRSHTPQTPVPPKAISNFARQYQRLFGELPPIWLEDLPEHCREPVRQGRVPAELLEMRWSGWPGRK